MLFWVLMKRVAKTKAFSSIFFLGLQFQKFDCVCAIRVPAKRHSWNCSWILRSNSVAALTDYVNQMFRLASTWFPHAAFRSGVRSSILASGNLDSHNCATEAHRISLQKLGHVVTLVQSRPSLKSTRFTDNHRFDQVDVLLLLKTRSKHTKFLL